MQDFSLCRSQRGARCPANNSAHIRASSRSHCQIKTRHVFCICPWQGQPLGKGIGKKWPWGRKLSTLEASREHMSLFCPPSNRIWNPSGKLCSTMSCVFFKHASQVLESVAKKWHQVIYVPSSLAFSLLFQLPFHLPFFLHIYGYLVASTSSSGWRSPWMRILLAMEKSKFFFFAEYVCFSLGTESLHLKNQL